MSAHSIRQNPPTCSLVSAQGPSESSSWRRRTRTARPSAGGRRPPPPCSTPRSSIRSLHPKQPSSACAAALSSPRISSRYRISPPYQTATTNRQTTNHRSRRYCLQPAAGSPIESRACPLPVTRSRTWRGCPGSRSATPNSTIWRPSWIRSSRPSRSALVGERRHGTVRSALAGLPLAVTDVFTTRGLPTTCGSRILAGWHPPYDATITRRLKQAGAIILGKTNMDEFAMGSSTENSAYGVTHNPWDLDKIPGGSSGGSAAAVAAYEAPLAIGTDTGGSIRQPAAVCGIVGTKPTYGGSSRYGVVAFASSLDTPGPFGRTVLDAALLHEAMSGHDPMDSTSIDAPVPPVVAAAREADVSGMRIGVVTELSGEG